MTEDKPFAALRKEKIDSLRSTIIESSGELVRLALKAEDEIRLEVILDLWKSLEFELTIDSEIPTIRIKSSRYNIQAIEAEAGEVSANISDLIKSKEYPDMSKVLKKISKELQ